MKNRFYIVLLTSIFIYGCSSSDVNEYIKDQADNIKGIVDDKGPAEKTFVEDDDLNVSDEIQDAIDAHNSARKDVNVNNDLRWDNSLAEAAQVYANKMADEGLWEHDVVGNDKYSYGENLYTSSQSITLKDAVDAWVDEKQYYTLGDIGDKTTCVEGEQCGHYTQIIWKSTSRVGCAKSQYKKDSTISSGPYKYWFIVVCKYQTPGNIVGRKPY
jgi:pathogenesis-related protein 1